MFDGFKTVSKQMPLGTAGLAFIAVTADLLIISILYQHNFEFTCRNAGPVWFCAFAGRIVPRAISVLAVLGMLVYARPKIFAPLAEGDANPYLGSTLNFAGLVAALLPWFAISDESSATMVALAIAAWSFGGLLMMIGLGLMISSPAAWDQILKIDGIVIGLALGVAAIMPELADYILPLWHVEAITNMTFATVTQLLEVLGYDVETNPETKGIGVPGFYVLVGPQCSGVEGFMLITAFLAFYMILFRDTLRFPHTLLLFPIGIMLSWSFNVIRIIVLLMIGFEGNPELAIGAFHSHAGWLAFVTLSLLLIVATRYLPVFQSQNHVARVDAQPSFFSDPAVVRIFPFLVFMATALMASTFTENPAVLYPLRAMLMGAALFAVWPSLRALPWRIDPAAVIIGGVIAVLWIVSAGPLPEDEIAPYGALAGGALLIWTLCRILGTAVFVPIIEELFFRDYLINLIAPKGGKWPVIIAVIVTTAAFAFLHGRWIEAGIAGVLFALLYLRKRNITDAIVAHAVANGSIAAWALTFDQWHIL